MSQSALYSEHHGTAANLTPADLGISSWEPEDVKPLQKKIGVKADGWFGPKSIKAWKAWSRKDANKAWKAWSRKHANETVPTEAFYQKGCIIISWASYETPEGVKVVNHLEPNGAPAQLNDTGKRRGDPIQMVLHRGVEKKRKSDLTYAHATERVLDEKGCSTTFTMDVDGVIYQHFDPGERHGIHCKYHNSQSDSIDIAGPFSQTTKPVAGQEPLTLKMAIGRRKDGLPPLKRKYGTVKCWTMTPAQRAALKVFLPWYCRLRGIPVTACDDWRTFRLSGGLGTKDPVTNVKGIIAHTNVADPGSRVDGILPLHHLKEDGCSGIEWRSAEDFLDG